MTRFFFVSMVFMIVFLSSCVSFFNHRNNQGIGENGFLTADGYVIRNVDGDEIRLRGVNLGGWLLQETWMSPVHGSEDNVSTLEILIERFGQEGADHLIAVYEDNWITTKDLDILQDIGINLLRVPFGYWNLQYLDGTWRRNDRGEKDFHRLDWIIEEAGKRGMYVLLDLHGAPGFASNAHSSGKRNASQLFEDSAEGEMFRQWTVDLWVEIARHYNHNPVVAGFDLLNEPMALPSDQYLWDYYDRMYHAIREVNPYHMISMEAIWELYNLPDPAVYGWENVWYQTHDYSWNRPQKPFVDEKLNNEILAREYGVPLLVGEFTAFEDPSDWEYTLRKYDEAGMHWTLWTYKLVKRGTTGWAMYSSPFVESPNVQTDSFEEIERKWSNIDTDLNLFQKNPMVVNAVRESLARPLASAVSSSDSLSAESTTIVSRYEAEDAVILNSRHKREGIPEGTEQQGFFSGNLAAGGIDNTVAVHDVLPDWSNIGHVRFDVVVEQGGLHELTIAYNGDDDKHILVKVNNDPSFRVDIPSKSGGGWNVMLDHQIDVDLKKGENEIWISGSLGGKGWLNIDYIELVKAGEDAE
ncbi:cellulase family glycosylhydrolase [Spirochaeta dissipatitropha]